MKKYFLLYFLLLIGHSVLSQEISDADFLKIYKSKILKDTELSYKKQTQYLADVYRSKSDTETISDIVKNLTENSKDLADIAKLFNPSSKELSGKSYNDFIKEMAKKFFVDGHDWGEDEANNKDRIRSVINTLTNESFNPKGEVVNNVIKGFFTSNPIVDLAGKVITGIASFFKADKKANRITDIKRAFMEEDLLKFNQSLKEYISFYEEGLRLNEQFAEQLTTSLKEVEVTDSLLKENLNQYQLIVEEALGKSDINVIDIRATFKYSFEKEYLKGYHRKYSTILAKATKVTDLKNQMIGLETKVDFLIKNYLDEAKAIAKDYQSKAKGGKLGSITDLTRIEDNVDNFYAENGLKESELLYASVNNLPARSFIEYSDYESYPQQPDYEYEEEAQSFSLILEEKFIEGEAKTINRLSVIAIILSSTALILILFFAIKKRL